MFWSTSARKAAKMDTADRDAITLTDEDARRLAKIQLPLVKPWSLIPIQDDDEWIKNRSEEIMREGATGDEVRLLLSHSEK